MADELGPDDQYLVNDLTATAYRDPSKLVYFIGRRSRGLIKIGYSADPNHRLRSLRRQSGAPLELLATTPGGIDLESAYHILFAAARKAGEWFERVPEIEAEITRLNTHTA